MNKDIKRMRYILSPELTDGDHWVPVDSQSSVIEAVENWMAENDVEGESFSVKIKMMTDNEIEALPEI
jgi:hypothetical protein